MCLGKVLTLAVTIANFQITSFCSPDRKTDRPRPSDPQSLRPSNPQIEGQIFADLTPTSQKNETRPNPTHTQTQTARAQSQIQTNRLKLRPKPQARPWEPDPAQQKPRRRHIPRPDPESLNGIVERHARSARLRSAVASLRNMKMVMSRSDAMAASTHSAKSVANSTKDRSQSIRKCKNGFVRLARSKSACADSRY